MFDSEGPQVSLASCGRVAPTIGRRSRAARQPALIDLTELRLPDHAVAAGGNHGEIFTRRWIVELILDLVGYDPDHDLSQCRALEPACGHGAFLVAMVERLSASLKAHGRNLAEARESIRAYDLLPANVEHARGVVVRALRAEGWPARDAAASARAWVMHGDFLLQDEENETADVVLGNPPYIRLEDVPAARSAAYRRECKTMGGRADVFVGFYEKGLRALRPGGRLGYICADRWMRNAYGKDLRALVAAEYAVDVSIAMHDVDAFEDQVSAYPAITVLRAGAQGSALVADTTRDFDEHTARDLAKWVAAGETVPLHRTGLTAAWLPHWFPTAEGWPAGSPDRLALVSELEERFPLIESTGVKIGIGLASGADAVFVTKDVTVAEPERMLPMAVRRDLREGRVDWSGHYLVNPWGPEGLVDLADWPQLAKYLRKHRHALGARDVARRNPGREHRTIDRVIEGLRDRPKLLLADMSERVSPVLDEGKYYPHHNLYWLTSDEWDLRVLGGLLLSDIAQLFVGTYCVRMRGGTLRLQAQYLRRIRVPRFRDIPKSDRAILRKAFNTRDRAAATAVAARLYGIETMPM